MEEQEVEIPYGASSHYQDESGRAYFETQNDARNQALATQFKVWKFQPWIRSEDTLLDFGCGGGWLLKELSAARKVGVELNPAAHPVCRSNGIEVYSRISEVPDQKFTRIVSNHCLEHVPHPIHALRELRQKLAADGLMILVLPIDDWRVEKDATGQDYDHHLFTWTPRLIANTLHEAGFHTESATVLTSALPRYWPQLYRVLPGRVFQLLCTLWSVLRRQREMIVIARPK